MTRTGKIARLPKTIREQINTRLENGEREKTIATWLNQLPEIQKIITDQFAGHPIRQQNISQWRQGGYLDWTRHQLLREQTRSTSEQATDLAHDTDEASISIAEDIAMILSAELALHVQALSAIRNPKERFRQFRHLARELSRLRRDDQRAIRTRLRRQIWQSTLEPVEAPETVVPPVSPEPLASELPTPNSQLLSPVSNSQHPKLPGATKRSEGGLNSQTPPRSADCQSAVSPTVSRPPLDTSPTLEKSQQLDLNFEPQRETFATPTDASRDSALCPQPSDLRQIDPLPLSENNSSTPKLFNSQTSPPPARTSTPDPSALPVPNSLTPKLLNSLARRSAAEAAQTPPSNPPIPTKTHYKVSAIPIRGRRFTCVEG